MFSVQGSEPLSMRKSEIKDALVSSIGSVLSTSEDSKFEQTLEFGAFVCSVEKFDQFNIVKRQFETAGESVYVPFTSAEPSIQMIFSFNGRSFFNRQSDPFMMSPSSHSINFFKGYDCTNLMAEKSKQHDITFRLKKRFYADLIAQHLSSAEDHLPGMIANGKEFNTINQHLPIDAAVSGILGNILECPFHGAMKEAYLREHIRALLTLQLFHFNTVLAGKPLRVENEITPADREKLHAVKEYIDQNFLAPSSLESLSRNFGLNEFKLKNSFKSLFDTSPIRYLQQKRLAYAIELLQETDKTIKEISFAIGYSHPANFTSAFVKTFGKPPQEYRTSSPTFFLREERRLHLSSK
jgi:AraC-like DNA-binding protein